MTEGARKKNKHSNVYQIMVKEDSSYFPEEEMT